MAKPLWRATAWRTSRRCLSVVPPLTVRGRVWRLEPMHMCSPVVRRSGDEYEASPVDWEAGAARKTPSPPPAWEIVPTSPANAQLASPATSAHAPALSFALGTRVRVNGTLVGTLRYYGWVAFADGLWIGVQLNKRCGRNDGAVDGQRYFSCLEGYGLFVRPERVAPILGSRFRHAAVSP